MSAEMQTEPRSTGYRLRVSEFLESRRGKMFGVAEVAHSPAVALCSRSSS
jgi:hypothetical protein